MSGEIKDDLRQSLVVARNELLKNLSGKRIILFSAIMLVIVGILTMVPLFEGGYGSAEDLASTFLTFTGTIIMLACVMFTAASIASEYEDRTALLIFTRPIKKISIYMGKLMTSLFVVMAYVVVFYVILIVYSMICTGSVVDHLGDSFCLSMCAVFGVSGIAMMLSTIVRKASTASILTLILTVLMLPMIAHVFADHLLDMDMSWMITEAMKGIPACILPTYGSSDMLRDSVTMLAWGAISTVIGYVIFRKKDF